MRAEASDSRGGWVGHLAAAIVVLAVGLSLYYASRQIDYEWRWERVPHYLVETGGTEIPAPFDGTVKFAPDGQSLTLTPLLGGGEPVTVAGFDRIEVSDGDIVFAGNTLGREHGWSAGPLAIGLWMTLKISLASLVFALILGLVVGLGRVSRRVVSRDLAALYVEVIRGTPLLVQIFIFYFFIGTVLSLSAFAAGVAALSVFTAAYIAEIVRGGIEAVPRGQTEAARSLGMSAFQAMRHVVLPQALRSTSPALAGQFINLIKDSSLVSIMALTDLTKAGREVVSSTFSPFEVWFCVALLYLALTGTLSFAVRRLERRLDRHD
ncbi:amino acid ABC transporter permease [Panacagrimonas perspica]|uniref:amino acid ABC transporter permease n=1 Tax=Panacagrimonas perspica TaxID=381431 RepID=UPI001FE27A92|nr:amino acid ABC transporter permease [Panacagrimonas perspica]